MSMQGNTKGPFTYLNGDTGVIPSNYLVTLNTTAGEVVTCGDGGLPIGFADGDVGMTAEGTFIPLCGRVLLKATALSAITAGVFVMADAGGTIKMDTGVGATRTAFTIGQAETAVSGDTGAEVDIYVVCARG